MNIAPLINLVASLLLALAIYKQIRIVVSMEFKYDPHRWTKIFFPVCTASILIAMWLPFWNHAIASALFFLISAIITFITYYI